MRENADQDEALRLPGVARGEPHRGRVGGLVARYRVGGQEDADLAIGDLFAVAVGLKGVGNSPGRSPGALLQDQLLRGQTQEQGAGEVQVAAVQADKDVFVHPLLPPPGHTE
jgi:hypothetical protein